MDGGISPGRKRSQEMTKQQIIKYSILGMIAIAAIILMISLLTSYRNKGDDHYNELIKAKDETIKAIQEQRDIYKQLNAEKDERIEQHFKNDSILITQSKQLNIKYEKIPVYINSLDRENLRSAVWNY